jgi:thiamine-phosphate pyrophosphorylase
MKLIVISTSKNSSGDSRIITELFENGLNRFHLRKPAMSTKDMRALIEAVPQHFHNRIIIHSHHKLAGIYKLGGIHLTSVHRRRRFSTWLRMKLLMIKTNQLTVSTSFHKLGHVYSNEEGFDYILLGTIFERLGGRFNAGYSEHSLRAVITKTAVPLVARGGTTADSIPMCADLGFHGVAFGSTIWNAESPVKAWCDILNSCKANSVPVQ